jgi:hypothetical protein
MLRRLEEPPMKLPRSLVVLALLMPAPSATANDTWAQLAPSGTPPGARRAHTAIHDPLRDRMVVFGGFDLSSHNDVWALALAGTPAWTQLAPSGTPPSARLAHTAIYDPVRDRMVVFGGDDGSFRNDVWELSLAGTPAWTQLTPTGTPPSGRYGHTAIYDPPRDRMLLFGGSDGTHRNDVWELTLAGPPAWSQLAPSGTLPVTRREHTSFYDPLRDRMVVFAGFDATAGFLNDVWALSLGGTPTWAPLGPGGTPPSPRRAPMAIYDPVDDRMVEFAGYPPYQNDVWALPLSGTSAWMQLAPDGTPPSPRYWPTAIYDPVSDRMVVFGGVDATLTFQNDVWELVLESVVAVGDAPPTRIEFALPRPNPSRAEVTFDFALPGAAPLSIVICDVAGRVVWRVAEGTFAAGRYRRTWAGRDLHGGAAPSGVYFVRYRAPGVNAERKVSLVR